MEVDWTTPVPRWMYEKTRITFVCENCHFKKTEFINIRHVKLKKYCKKCQKTAAHSKFIKNHPAYDRDKKRTGRDIVKTTARGLYKKTLIMLSKYGVNNK